MRLRPIVLSCAFMLAALFLASTLFAADSTAIKISSNGRYFVDGNGKPFFWVGDTQWDLFAAFTAQNAQSVCADRRAKGFSALQIMIYGVRGPSSANNFGQNAWVNNNSSSLNEPYFRHIDSIIDAGHANGLQMVIGVYHRSWSSITTSNARAMATAIATRYKDKPNIMWSMYPPAENGYTALVREAAAGLQAGDAGAHLITVHPDPSPASGSFWQSEPWLSFPTLQTWSSDFSNYNLTAADYARTPVKPAVNGEARYETEGGTTPLDIRHGAWWSYLAGGFYSYGHGSNWLSPTTWQTWINSPGANHMKVLAALLRSLSWWKLVPDQSVFSSTPGASAAARSSDGDWVLAYLSANASATVNLGKITAADSAAAWWVDPTSGVRTKIGTYRATGTRVFAQPNGWQDAVLLLEKSDGVTAIRRPGASQATNRPAARQMIIIGADSRMGSPAAAMVANLRGQRVQPQAGGRLQAVVMIR